MGFSYRKSFKVGKGFKINVSSKGIGVSAGVKGARVSVGPRGVNAYGSIGPIRMQKNLLRASTSPGSGGKVYFEDSDLTSKLIYARPSNLHFWYFCATLPTILYYCSASTCFLSFLSGYIVTYLYPSRAHKGWRDFVSAEKSMEKKSLEEQLHFYQEELKLDKNCNYIKLKLANLLRNKSLYSEAAELFKTLALAYKDKDLCFLAGECFQYSENYSEALYFYENCDQSHEWHNYILVLPLKAQCLMRMKEYDRALEVISTAMRKRGDEYAEMKRQLRVLRAEVYINSSDMKKAKSELTKLLREVPGYEDAEAALRRVGELEASI